MHLPSLWRTNCGLIAISLAALVILSAALGGLYLPAQDVSFSPPKASLLIGGPEAIYSGDPNDSWNRIFYYLFSRRIETRLSDQFPEGAPFVDGVSTRLFERDEVGDRAIDPLYPSNFVNAGRRLVLTDPAFGNFRKALQDAIDDHTQRSAVARALLQSDLWGAHDLLFFQFPPVEEEELGERRLVALDLISRLIKKIALTPDEIKALPRNYSATVREHSFPDMFAKDSPWVEVLWFYPRSHDDVAGFRRTARVFLKLKQPQPDVQQLLDGMPDRQESNPIFGLDGAALVTQVLLIDSQGKLEPTSLTSEVQVRLFEAVNRESIKPDDGTLKMMDGTFERARLQVCEISRRLFLREPESGGLVLEESNSPAYAGHYGFAEGEPVDQGDPDQRSQVASPIQVTLRARCAFCHGDGLTQLNTFAIVRPPHPPAVRRLNPSEHVTAKFVIERKEKQRDFQALLAYFDRRTARH
jgi:hypothetical protein